MFRPDVVLAFAFGAPAHIPPNLTLSRVTVRTSRRYNVPIFTQPDIYVEDALAVFAEARPGEYLSTLDIVKQFVEAAGRKKWCFVRVIAAPPHERRCIRDLKEIARRQNLRLQIEGDELIENGACGNEWYCRESNQLWTRSQVRWWLREFLLRRLPFHLYEQLNDRLKK